MTWLVTGVNGQLGMAFRRALAERDDARFVDRTTCDLSNPASLAACLGREQPLSSSTAPPTPPLMPPRRMKRPRRVSTRTLLAKWLAGLLRPWALMVHFSTDYVFDGSAVGAYDEDAPVKPLSAYGRSKAAGEELFMESGARGLCLRTSWVHSNRRQQLSSDHERLMQERDHLRIVDDQHGVPTTTDFPG